MTWAQAFERAARWLGPLAGPGAQIAHIGSTAVPGLGAKPIIDILVGLDTERDLAGAAARLRAEGFLQGSSAEASTPILFLSRGERGDEPAINLHLTVVDSLPWRNLICFRDKLRKDAALASSYETLKRRLAETAVDIDAYTAGKGAFVARVLESGS